MTGIAAEAGVLRFLRSEGETDLLCLFNLTDNPATVICPDGWDAVEGSVPAAGTLALAPWAYAILRKDGGCHG